MEKEVGKVIHWYDKIGVAVVKLAGKLAQGDKIKVKRGAEEFEDAVASMQINHEAVSAAKKGDEVALALSQKVKEGAKIYKIE